MSFGASAVGYALLIIAIVSIAYLIHLERSWILGTTLLFVGLGVVSGVHNTREKDSDQG
jgi:hypothetical protein